MSGANPRDTLRKLPMRVHVPITVLAAIASDFAITIAKFAAASISGSAAMLSEGFHSLVDTCNQALLVFGISRAGRGPDLAHPFGYGKELYFWSLLLSIVLFAVGGGLSVYEGVARLRNGSALGDPSWSYVVLLVSLLAEGVSWLIAKRELRTRGHRRSIYRSIVRSKDPSLLVVLAEDTAALVGGAIAFAGVLLSQLSQSHIPDAVASVSIGCLLGATALLLCRETRNLLIGESAHPELVRRVEEIARSHPFVERVQHPLTMQLGPKEVLVAMDLTLRTEGRSGEELVRALDGLERQIRQLCPEVTRVYLSPYGPTNGRATGDAPEPHASSERDVPPREERPVA